MRIGLLSDTHSYLDPQLLPLFEECDELWHAGDVGQVAVIEKLEAFRPLRGVYGNIDDATVRRIFPLNQVFTLEGVKVCMTHIGGYPGRYTARVRQWLDEERPKLYICGHSHILKVMPDRKRELLHINPGAAGIHGFHKMRTATRFTLDNGSIKDLEVLELGLRGATTDRAER